MLWNLAWRFALKQWKRNLLVVGAIAVSVFVLVFLSSLMSGVRDQYLAEVVRQGGHLQVHAAGWAGRTDPVSLDPALDHPNALMATIRAVPGVAGVEPVLPFGALLMKGDRNLTVEADGIVPGGPATEPVRRHLISGDLALGPQDIAVSRAELRLLGAQEGQPLVLLTQDVDGVPQYREFHVRAVFDTANPSYDETHVLVSLANAQDLTGLIDQALELRVLLDRPQDAAALAPRVAALSPGHLEVTTWQLAQGSFLVFLKVFDVFMLGIDILIIVVAAAVITNAILMNFLERVAVLSTLRAVGLKDRQTWGLVLREGVIQGVLGALLGLIAGLAVVVPLSGSGLDLGEAAAALGLGATIPLGLSPALLAQSAAAGLLTALVAALWAGRTGARTPILEGLTEE